MTADPTAKAQALPGRTADPPGMHPAIYQPQTTWKWQGGSAHFEPPCVKGPFNNPPASAVIGKNGPLFGGRPKEAQNEEKHRKRAISLPENVK